MPETLISPLEGPGPGLAATDSKENISGSVNTKASTSTRKKSAARINMKAVAQICKGKHEHKPANPTSLPPPDLVGRCIYNHFCHTCNVHFPTVKGFEQHMFTSPAHGSFKLRGDIAETLGYLEISDNSGDGSLDHGKSDSINKHTAPGVGCRVSELDPCKRANCACPRFKFTPPQDIVVDPVADLDLFTSLDGSAGSALNGHRADEDDDPENFTLSHEKPLPDIVPEEEEPYMRPPDSSDEDEVKWQKGFPNKPRRTCEDRTEMRRRFGKGKNKKAERAARREENIPNSEKYFRPIPQPAERRVLDAYAAADEKLFGQKRFEELDDEMEAQKEAVANWQEGIGMKATLDDDPKNAADQLAQDIDHFIHDVLSEIGKQAEKERHDKRYNNKLFFEDTLEDVAIDHESNLADQDQEKFRKAAGKKQNEKLRDLKTEDIVDDIAMDYNQEVGEKEEEHHRKTIGRIESKGLAGIRASDMVDDLAMDHLQEVDEKKQEHHRKTIGRIQSKQLTDTKTDDTVDNLAMDHLQEVDEKEQEHHRKAIGRTQSKKLTDTKMDDTVDNLAMGHLQEVDEKKQEHHRKAIGRVQSKKLTDTKMDDTVDNLAMGHLQEVDEKKQEYHRKAIGRVQSKKLTDTKTDDTVDNLAMDHLQEVDEKKQEHHRKAIGRTQSKKLTDTKMDDTVDNLAMGHLQEVDEKKQEYHRKAIGRVQSKKLTDAKMDDTVDNLAMDHAQEAGQKEQEYRRESAGRLHRELTSMKMLDHVDNLGMEKTQTNHRKNFEAKETKQFKHGREADLVDSLGMDCVQEVNEEVQEHQRKSPGTQPTKRLKLGDGSLKKSPGNLKERPYNARSYKESLAANIIGGTTGNDAIDLTGGKFSEWRMTAGQKSNEMMVGGMDVTVSPTATDPDQNARGVAMQKSNSSPIRCLAAIEAGHVGFNKGRELWHEKGGGTIQDNLTILGTHSDYSGLAEANRRAAINHETSWPEQGISSIVSELEVEVKNSQDDSDGYSSPAPVAKKDRKQLREEANAKFEAMMEEMVRSQGM